MRKTLSIVEARRELGRLAEEVRHTGHPVVLTRRGRAVARTAPEPAASAVSPRRPRDPFGPLRGAVRMNCSFDALQRAVRALRSEFARNLAGRAVSPSSSRRRA